MDMTEKMLESREVYRGRILRVREDKVLLPNGKTGTREVVEHPGGVGILALDDEDRVALVRQYRYAFSRVLTEIPAGKREKGEEPFVTARRELKVTIPEALDRHGSADRVAGLLRRDAVSLYGPGAALRRDTSGRGRISGRDVSAL